MGLNEIAAADFESIASNTDEWGRNIVLKNPQGETINVNGITGDISEVIDPDTGQLVQGRRCHVRIPMRFLSRAGFKIPENITSTTSKVWTVTFYDVHNNQYLFKVVQTSPDRTLSCVTLMLEVYKY